MKINVAHIISAGVEGGATSYIKNTVPKLNNSTGFCGYIVLLKPLQPFEEKLLSSGFNNLVSFDCRTIKGIIELYKWVKTKKIAIIHTHGPKANMIGLCVARLLSLKCISTKHSHYAGFGGSLFKEYLQIMLEKTTSILTDLNIYVSEFVRKCYSQDGTVLYSGVDMQHECVKRTSSDILRLLSVARLSKEKGIDLAIEMLAGIQDIEWEYTVVGDGAELHNLKLLVKQYGIENRVFFVGFQNEVEEYICKADVLVMTSHTEGLPLAPIEAAMLGCPTLGYDVGGMSEVVYDERTGWLVEFGNKEKFKEKLKDIYLNREKLEMACRNAKLFAIEEFSIEKHMYELEKIYSELIV